MIQKFLGCTILAGAAGLYGLWAAATAISQPASTAIQATSAQTACAQDVSPGLSARQIQDDWFAQARLRTLPPQGSHAKPQTPAISPADDAAGAVDGIKNGKWGFHTNFNDQPAWWQVDLGKSQPLANMLVFNRCDFPTRTADMQVLLSIDGKTWTPVYKHNGTPFYGFADKKPLAIALNGAEARFVRLQIPPHIYFHLDEVEIYAQADPQKNIALHCPADQSSVSQWSVSHQAKADAIPATASGAPAGPDNRKIDASDLAIILDRGRKLAADLRSAGVDTAACQRELDAVAQAAQAQSSVADASTGDLYIRARQAVRTLALSNPALDFDSILFVKRAPGFYSHISDQNYSWWQRCGGGIYILEGFKTDSPRVRCLTGNFAPGSFLSPELSYDGKKVLFSYSRYYPDRQPMKNKLDKDAQAEDSFFHVFEMNLDGSELRQITHGKYDDIFARYLPDGELVFLSTRRGTALQCGKASAEATTRATLPDSYVRCGGNSYRPVAIYTLHTMDSAGQNMRAISAFESFEWDPCVASDGRILYARWDYVDRTNTPFMKLWSTNPDGTGVQIVFGNYTVSPHCIFEARPIPNSKKLLCTAAGHHSITAGSLIILDPTLGILDGQEPITRLTPEVCFPETEGWPQTYFNSPWPLSETYYLCSWSNLPQLREGHTNPPNAMGIYLYDAFGNLEPLYRDANISSMCPIPLRPRPVPPVVPSRTDWAGPQEGRFLLQNVYEGLPASAAGTIARLRIVAMPIKTQPVMNSPVIGVTVEDPGKCVLGTVPVEKDGSAYFRAPSGVGVFFQALDANNQAVQTMRSITYVQAGTTSACIGCHEGRNQSPHVADKPLAMLREPSKIAPDVDGSWPLQFSRLIQPALDKNCVSCHSPGTAGKQADPQAGKPGSRLDLTAGKAYDNLVNYGKPSVRDNVRGSHDTGVSVPLAGPSHTSAVLNCFRGASPRCAGKLDDDTFRRLTLWMDTYGQKQGSFCSEQEDQLRQFRKQIADLLTE